MSTSFEIVLRRPTAVASAAVGPSGLDFDSIVMDLCQVIADSDCYFRIGGFGQTDWPVDVRYDLSTLIEQLPAALDGVRSRLTVEIDFYAQGIERTVRFTVKGDCVAISCQSRTSWSPDTNVENIAYSDLVLMLESVAKEFAESLRLVWPQLTRSVPFVNWL